LQLKTYAFGTLNNIKRKSKQLNQLLQADYQHTKKMHGTLKFMSCLMVKSIGEYALEAKFLLLTITEFTIENLLKEPDL